jgi:PHD/YefM family antitoxin component YafN of YafNO toxin-antitoxin module
MINSHSFKTITDSIIPITRFNRGEANKIFDEVKKSGAKIVFKNNVPACVLVDPEAYEQMIEMLEDYALYFEAEARLENAGQTGFLSQEQILNHFGIDESELDGDIDVDIE